MTRARALLALSLVTSGAMLGGLSLSGYYEPRTPQSPPVAVAPSALSESALKVQVAPHGRLRFVAAADEKLGEKPVPPAAKPKAPAKAAPVKVRPEPRARPEPAKRPQQAAAPWPWSMFDN